MEAATLHPFPQGFPREQLGTCGLREFRARLIEARIHDAQPDGGSLANYDWLDLTSGSACKSRLHEVCRTSSFIVGGGENLYNNIQLWIY